MVMVTIDIAHNQAKINAKERPGYKHMVMSSK